MHSTSTLLALSATFSHALAAYQGFNYGSTFTSGAAKAQSDFEAEFSNAQKLAGTNGAFSSARLYTMIQAGTPNTPISAIPAALKTKTSLLLGMWASAGQEVFNNELAALKSTISQYGNDLAPLVAGISVGSEDLYRISPTGLLNKENPGVGPDVLTAYIKSVRDAVAGTPLSGVKIGHVDTWTAYANGSNKAVVDASDFLGVDAYPYFQDTMDNGIESSKSLFNSALDQVRANANGKELWITETGFPVSGPTRNKAVPGLDNAKTYWQQVGCPMFGSTNVWWFTMQDAAPTTPSPSFGLIGSTLTSTPLYDLSCQNVNTGTSSSSAPSAASSSVVAPSNTAGPVLGGGSPGAGNGIPSSQLSIETQTSTGGATSPTQGLGSGSGSSGSGSGSGSASGSGSGSGSNGNSTVPTGRPTPSQTNMAGAIKSGSWSAAFLAVMVAMVAL